MVPDPPATKTFMTLLPFPGKTDRQAGAERFGHGEQHRGRREKRPPLRVDMGHVIRAGQHEVIHEPEYERTCHRGRDEPGPDSLRPPRQCETDQRSCQDDDEHEQIRGA